ncbi:hypothetical protein BKI52_39545 [marine bacterium AO1-C]|nr:hypothetical protein BKI52_39545 [marine bacterium AO1-C]
MTKVKSKFSWVHTYLVFIVLLLLSGGMLIGVVFAYLSNHSQESDYQYIFWIIVLSALILLLVFSTLKVSKTISLTNQGIVLQTVFKRQEILWSEIKAIKLHGKENWLFTPQEATTFFLHNGKKVFIINALYRNTPLLKTALNTVKKQHLRGQPIDIQKLEQHKLKQTSQQMPNYPLTKYSGDFWFSINGIVIVLFTSMTLFWLIVLLITGGIGTSIFMSLSFLPAVLSARQLNYFYLGRYHLVVRNHVWRPYIKVYHLEDIEEVVFDSVGESSDGIRIITKDFKAAFFPAGSLREKNWIELVKALRKRKIKIRPKNF